MAAGRCTRCPPRAATPKRSARVTSTATVSLDSAEEIDAALASGALVDDGIVKYFVCTLNKVPANH